MKRLCIALVSLVITLQLGAGAQNRPALLAYDYCGPVWGEGGADILCDVRLFGMDATPVSLMPGVRPEWSGDGLRLAVANYDLAIYNLVNGSTTYFPGTGWLVGQPRWSPDDTRIAFATERDGVRELYLIGPDGSALTRLTHNVGFRGAYAWSPDGTAIAFDALVGGVSELFVMYPDGSNKTRLTYAIGFSPDYPDTAPSWSADGAQIAFGCANNICSINADGTNLKQLTTETGWAWGAVFSPVDGRIAFLTSRFGGYGAYEVAILEENGAVTRIAPGLRAAPPAWSPDGSRLAFVNVLGPIGCPADNSCDPEMLDTIYTVNRDGSTLAEVGQGHRPRWATSRPGQPAAAFTYNCNGVACQFDATASFDPDGSITSYVWDFGDGTTGTGVTPAHQYAAGKPYDVRLIVTDNAGAVGVSLRNVWANAAPVASFTVSCTGPTCRFDASASSDRDGIIDDYTWNFGDGWTFTGVMADATHTYGTGTFLATLSVRDSGGRAASAEVSVTVVNAVPVAAFTATCSGLTCTLDARASSDDDVIFYKWEFGNGSSQATSEKVTTGFYQAGGTYPVTLTITDRAGQTATASQTVTVIAPPLPETHVGNLTGSATSQKNTWSPYVTVQMHGANHQVVSGIQVTATWSNGSTQSCATGTDGSCWFALDLLPNKTSVATLTITAAVSSMWLYKPVANHDADGSSNGTVITVRRR